MKCECSTKHIRISKQGYIDQESFKEFDVDLDMDCSTAAGAFILKTIGGIKQIEKQEFVVQFKELVKQKHNTSGIMLELKPKCYHSKDKEA